MDIFQTTKLGGILMMLSDHHARLHVGSIKDAAERLDGELFKTVTDGLEYVHSACKEIGFDDTAIRVNLSLAALRKTAPRVFPLLAEVAVDIRKIREDVFLESGKRCFLAVPHGLDRYVDREDLFGDKVKDRFQSAARDIREAGNCMAAGCDTAAVFHLMRSAEFGLRALARDRAVGFSDKPLEEKEWGQILSNLEGKITALRQCPGNRWSTQAAREPQIRFYSEVVQELRSFNDAWRKHVCHADTLAFYDPHQAMSTFNHVRAFMQKLASKISENSVTPEFWGQDEIS